jgi:hypothetical protein
MIEEIPLDLVMPAVAEAVAEPVAKKRGRPAGSLNKVKSLKGVHGGYPTAPEPAAAAPERGDTAGSAQQRGDTAGSASSRSDPPDPPAVPEKAKGRPKPLAKTKRRRERPPSLGSDSEPPTPDRSRRSCPQPQDTATIATEVLKLLSNRHVDKSDARRAKYSRWFLPN